MKPDKVMPNPFTQGEKKEVTSKPKSNPSKVTPKDNSGKKGNIFKGRYV